MRKIPIDIAKKLAQTVQTTANGAAPSTDLWINRPTTALTQQEFLERQIVFDDPEITGVSVAICHPTLGINNTDAYIAYLQGGAARVTKATIRIRMEDHIWQDTGFEAPADAVAIAFDGSMQRNLRKRFEFVTERDPWVFWVYGGRLYGRYLTSSEPVVLAESNCTAVTAVRATWSENPRFDFGLCVFFILDGAIYCRQRIGSQWEDAAPINFGPEGERWADIAATRTWDYRVVLQAKAESGKIYELYTQYGGIGSRNQEHIEVKVQPTGGLLEIQKQDAAHEEHLDVSVAPTGALIYGLTSKPLAAENIDDGAGNWGLLVRLTMDYPVTGVDNNAGAFSMQDSDGVAYSCTAAQGSEVLTLTFVDFNSAEGKPLTLRYTPGTVQSPATPLEAFEIQFEPVNLVAPDVDPPEVLRVWNESPDGTDLYIQFTQPLVGDISGLNPPIKYKQQKANVALVATLNQYSSSYPAANLIDGSTSTYWRGTTAENWMEFTFAEPTRVTGLRMYLGSYYIKTFTISAQTESGEWEQIGGEFTAASSTTGKWYEFEFENPNSYTAYRINTLTAYSTSRIYVYEVELIETVPSGNADALLVTIPEWDYVPGGTLAPAARAVAELEQTQPDTLLLKFPAGNQTSLQNAAGDITVAYAGGSLAGQGGPVEDFTQTFTPVQMVYKGGQNDAEHIEVAVDAEGVLTRVKYNDTKTAEHLEVTVSAVGVLTNINDV